VYDALLDPTDATDLLLDAISTAEPTTIQQLWQLTEHISRDPVLSPLAAAVVAAHSDERDAAIALASAAGAAAGPHVKREAARRLRQRAAHRTGQADLFNSLADIVAALTDDDAPQ
jgi:hypothetical protein